MKYWSTSLNPNKTSVCLLQRSTSSRELGGCCGRTEKSKVEELDVGEWVGVVAAPRCGRRPRRRRPKIEMAGHSPTGVGSSRHMNEELFLDPKLGGVAASSGRSDAHGGR